MDSDTQPTGDAGTEQSPIDVVHVPDGAETPQTVRDAARALSEWRAQRRQAAAPPAAAAPDENLAPEADTAPSEEASGETVEQVEAATPIDLPQSWSKEDREWFADLQPEIQQNLGRFVDRERSRDTDINRRLNETAEKAKAYDAEKQALANVRAQAEQVVQQQLQAYQASVMGEFADVRTQEDADRLASDDWPRWIQWRQSMDKLQSVQQQQWSMQQQQQQEYAQQWSSYAQEQDKIFAEKIPEMTDPVKGKALSELVAGALQRDYGFTPEEMLGAWNGPFRDHRVQQILVDASRYRQLKSSPPKPMAKAVPPVQRPGAARAASSGLDAEIKAADEKLSQTGNWKDAARLQALKRQAAARR